MNIGVNTRLLVGNKLEGIGQFSDETLKRITVKHPEHTFYFFFDRAPSPEFIYSENVVPVKLSPMARHPILWWMFFEISVPKALKKYKIDLFLSPDGWLSTRTDVKSIAVIHDLNFEHFPEQIKWLVRNYYHRYFPRFAHKAIRIATVSNFSKNDIAKLYGINKNKIDVVYNGVKKIFNPLTEDEQLEVRQHYSKGSEYFVFVGLIHERKNLVGLFKAFEHFKRNDAKFKLVIVGEKKWWKGKIEEAYNDMEFKDDVIFTGRLADLELSKVMASSKALCYVPFFEGFGIPILEGMKCGVPVITSNTSSMPEVGADAAIYVDPHDHISIADAMSKIVQDSALREELAVKGRSRSEEFSWEKTADLLWNCVESAIR